MSFSRTECAIIVLHAFQNDKYGISGPKSDFFYYIVEFRFEDLCVDVEFAQILAVDCRSTSKNVVESTESRTPPGRTPPLNITKPHLTKLHHAKANQTYDDPRLHSATLCTLYHTTLL